MKKRIAFTLSEVLITLGVIGVVAAMTLPTVIKNYSKKETVVKLQKAISVLNQAYKLSIEDNGVPSDDEIISYENANEYFEKYWAPYIKKAKVCNTYKECGYSKNSFYYTASGGNISIVAPKYRTTFYTADGFVYLIMLKSASGDEYIISNSIYVDINGYKGPNTVGKDVFILQRTPNGNIRTYCYNKTSTEIKNKCSTERYECCSTKIEQDGWKIPDDYPW